MGSKRYLLARHMCHMSIAAELVQFNIGIQTCHWNHRKKKSAALLIQRYFRGWRIRMFLVWNKLRVLHRAEQAQVDRLNVRERRTAAELIGLQAISVVHVNAKTDIRQYYPSAAGGSARHPGERI